MDPTRTDRRNADTWALPLWVASSAAMAVALGTVFLYAPEERVMGAAQKIFYFHLPTIFVTYASVVVLFGSALGYLWTRDVRWDCLARAATEGGLLFCSVVLVTGSIWARPAWGTWWTWEARLTTTLVLWLLLAASLLVRSYADSRETGARLASVVGVVAVLDLPIIHKAVEWWRGQHPVLFAPGKRDALAPEMQAALGASILAFFLLWGLILALGYRLGVLEDRAELAVERVGGRE